MKKIVSLVLCFACLLAFNACGIERRGVDVNTSESVSEEKVLKVSTPYADLCLPETFDGVVANKVISKDPYTVSFYVIADKTELFLLFLTAPVIFSWEHWLPMRKIQSFI